MNKSRAKTGLVRKLTRGGPPKLFLMKTKKGDHPKGSQDKLVANYRFLRNQEVESTETWSRGNYSEDPDLSAWAMAPRIDESVFEESIVSRYPGDVDEEKGHHSSLSMPGVRGQDSTLSQVPVKCRVKPGKEARARNKRWMKGTRGSRAAWGSLLCVKKMRKHQEEEEEAEEETLNGQQTGQILTKAERQTQSCLPAQLPEHQREVPRLRHNIAGCDSDLSSPADPSLGAQAEEDDSKAATPEEEPEIQSMDSRAKLRRRSSGWASFRYLMKSRKDWTSFIDKSTNLSGSQSQSETGIPPDSWESEVTASSDSKAPELIGEQRNRSPSEDPEGAAYSSSPLHTVNKVLHSETAAIPLTRHQDPAVSGASEDSQAEIHWDVVKERVGIEGSLPAMFQDEMGHSKDNGEETLVDGGQDGNQWVCDFEPVSPMLSLRLTPQREQCEIGSAKLNPSHPLGSDGFPGGLQEELTPATLRVVIESERQERAQGILYDSRLAHSQRTSPILLRSSPLAKEDNIERIVQELLTIEEATQKLESCDLTESVRKTTNPACFSPGDSTKQGQEAYVGANRSTLGFVEQGMNIVAASPGRDPILPPGISEEVFAAECQAHKCVNWNNSPEDGSTAGNRGGDADPASDAAPGLEFLAFSSGADSQEAVLVHTASCIVQSAMQAAVEQVAGETAMKIVPENCPLPDILDS
ncbi:uncharacterized protein LOC132210088 [Stegostoma tigrinum]|uniref:uncharacterized protein LOC132210088 n=1 Tax=Stegostoma tigrinum TaxID=3053191 RepID=UPI0028705EAD|nr:uncharacterized protein LOC132210088 [Stegostoma tigrinum]